MLPGNADITTYSDGTIRMFPHLLITAAGVNGYYIYEHGADLRFLFSYPTRSNKNRIVKTPGGKLRYQHLKKRGSPPKCGDCGMKLPGVREINYISNDGENGLR